VIGWMLTSVTLAEWIALGVELIVAAAIFVFRRKPGASPSRVIG